MRVRVCVHACMHAYEHEYMRACVHAGIRGVGSRVVGFILWLAAPLWLAELPWLARRRGWLLLLLELWLAFLAGWLLCAPSPGLLFSLFNFVFLFGFHIALSMP